MRLGLLVSLFVLGVTATTALTPAQAAARARSSSTGASYFIRSPPF